MRGTHPKRIHLPGHAHELTFGCYRRFPFLAKDRTRHWLAEAINRTSERMACHVWAWVFMPEHVHLLVHPQQPDFDVSQFLAQIKQPVSRKAVAYLKATQSTWLDRITTTRGQRTERLFWQRGGGYDRNIIGSEAAQASIAYIHANPVRRGLVASPNDWLWSSARFHATGEVRPVLTHKPVF